MNSSQAGNVAVAAVLAELVGRGEQVLIPFGDAQRYDLVTLNNNGSFTRIQVKKGRLSRNKTVIRFRTCSQSRNCPRKSYKNDAEMFAVHVADLGKIYFIPVTDAPETDCQLRLTPPKNGQRDGIRWAEDYENLGL